MKKMIGLFLAVIMVFTIMLPAAMAEEPVTISFFDKNSGVRTFDDPVAKELEKRTGIKLDLISPSGNPGEKLSLMLAGLNYPDIVLMDINIPEINGIEVLRRVKKRIPPKKSSSSRPSTNLILPIRPSKPKWMIFCLNPSDRNN